MNPFNSSEVTSSRSKSPVNISSPIKSTQKADEKPINLVTESSNVKPVQLDDFFEFLDSKTVQKIIDTPSDSRTRITQDVSQIEYETDGARAILNSLG